MFYKSTDATISTQDWFKLNVSAIPQSLIFRTDGDDPYERLERLTEIFPENRGITIPEWHVEPEAGDEEHGVQLFESPDPDMYGTDPEGAFTDEGAAQYTADLKAWEAYDAEAREAIREVEDGEREVLPMWGTMWRIEDHPELREALFAMGGGIRLYDHEDLGRNEILIGVDGAGFSFFGSYWIPLRARLAMNVEKTCGRDVDPALITMLVAEAEREGEAGTVREIFGIKSDAA